MLKKHKTFDLDKERVVYQPKCEKLYQPNKFKYSKCIVVPALIAFVLLCILINVDYTGEANKQTKHGITSEEEKLQFKSYITRELLNDAYNGKKETTELETSQEDRATPELQYDPLETKFSTQSTSEDYIDATTDDYNGNLETTTLKQNILTKLKEESTTIETTSESYTEPQDTQDLKEYEIRGHTKEDSSTEIYFDPQDTMELKQNLSPATFSNTALENRIAGPAECEEFPSYCSCYCSNGGVNYLDEPLNILQSKAPCRNTELSLIIEKCEFSFGTMTSAFFHGDFNLKYLAIHDSNLETIKDATFKHPNAQKLQTLILRNNLIIILTSTTFEGLAFLKTFEFVQQPLKSKLNADQFLKPLAINLTAAIISQFTDNNEILNPRNWLQGTEFSLLKSLDLASNNFQDILDSTTFRTLVAIETLILSNCSLVTIAQNTFDVALNTLKFLDLRNNHLQTLDLQLLNNVASLQIDLNLSGNEWYCDCDDTAMIAMFQNNEELMETIVCYKPEKWQNMELNQIINECEVIGTTVRTTTTSMITTTDTTTITTEDSTTTKTETSTTFSTTEIGENSSTSTATSSTNELVNDSSTTTTEISCCANTTPPPNSVSVLCFDANKTETIFWFIHLEFTIHTTSSTSVIIKLPDNLKNFDILYFTNYNDYMNLTKDLYTISNSKVNIKGLKAHTAYIFCLANEKHEIASPLNCQGHFVRTISIPWLLTKDQSWFIPVMLIINLVIIAASIFVVYVTLRKHPMWLVIHNGRLLKFYNSNQKIIALSKKASKTKESERSSTYLTAQQSMKDVYAESDITSLYTTQHTVPGVRAPNLPTQTVVRKSSCPSYDSAQKSALASKYISVNFNRFQTTTNENRNSLYISQHTVPCAKAPILPPANDVRKSSCPSYATSQKCNTKPEDNDDPDYQTIDHYEVVNF